jgi:hypothetical protein
MSLPAYSNRVFEVNKYIITSVSIKGARTCVDLPYIKALKILDYGSI